MLIPKVLLVNDDAAGLMALESLLTGKTESGDYEVVTARSGEEALRLVLQNEFALILLDVSMPVMDGFETAEAIHSHPRSASVPIIFITAYYADEINRLKGYQSGAVDYLFTPVIPQILQTKVAVFVELTKKNLLLQIKTQELAALNQDLRVQRIKDLERLNVELAKEVVERQKAEQREHELAIRDPLTGLLNRRSLMDHLERAVANAARRKEQIALLFLDLDKFKNINDTLGHDVGDDLLRQVSARLLASVRESDVVARLGGDEFVVLLEGISSSALASKVARKIAAANTRKYEIGPHAIKTSTSIGIGLYPQDGSSVQDLMGCADQAMYHAKHHKRGSIQFFHEEMNDHEVERLRFEGELQLAFDSNEFELLYQPRINLVSGRVACIEALLRWRHPRLGLLEPEKFLPAAAASGKLAALCEWVLAAACCQMKLWLDAELPEANVKLALSVPRQRVQTEYAHTVVEVLRKFKLTPSRLQLEFNEFQLLCEGDKVTEVLQDIHKAGIAITVDGFGTGSSALALLKTLPLHTVKIDRFLVRGLGLDPCDTAVVAATIDIARSLNLCVIADGVETEAQVTLLRTLGCDEYQGPYASVPLCAEAVLAQLREPASTLQLT